MSATKVGGISARDMNYAKQGRDFYERIGRIGGQRGHTGGFWNNHERAVAAGRIGGAKSSRKGIKNKERWFRPNDGSFDKGLEHARV